MSQDIDILNKLDSVDLASVKTSYPMLQSGLVTAQITGIEPDNEKARVQIKYTLTQPWKEVDGTPVQAGFPFSEFIYVNDWTDPETGEVKNFGIQRLAQLREAVFGKAAPGTKLVLSELLGQTVTVSLKHDPAPKNKKTGEVYGPQTSVANYIRKGK